MTATAKSDKWIPWYFVAFFVVIAIVDTIMVTLAIRTNSGLVTDHPYEKGLAYNQVVQAEQQQTALGWKASIDVQGNSLRVTLRDKNDAMITPDNITAQFTRPIHTGMDFSLTLEQGKAQVNFPAKGLWEIRIYATFGETRFQQSKRIVVQ